MDQLFNQLSHWCMTLFWNPPGFCVWVMLLCEAEKAGLATGTTVKIILLKPVYLHALPNLHSVNQHSFTPHYCKQPPSQGKLTAAAERCRCSEAEGCGSCGLDGGRLEFRLFAQRSSWSLKAIGALVNRHLREPVTWRVKTQGTNYNTVRIVQQNSATGNSIKCF